MTLGVVGAGTMGAGIAQLAAETGARTWVFDVVDGAAEQGVAAARAGLDRRRAKGALAREPGELVAAGSLAGLAGCELVVEAIAEDLDAKRALVAELSALAPGTVIATNTSSIPVTSIASAATDPGRVVGLHFFNPAPVMRLVELVRAVQSSEAAVERARAVAEAMGRHVVEVPDAVGFLVNRCNRPFGLEALRLLESGVADVPTIDRIVRGAGYRMGPFELADLVGLDTSFAVSRSFFAQGFGEPRWRPSPRLAQLVAAGRLGRKTGEGWYRYAGDGTHRPEAPPPPPPGVGGDGRVVVVAGDLVLAHDLRDAAADAGWDVRDAPDGDVPHLLVDCGHDPEDGGPLQAAPQLVLCAGASLHQQDGGGAAVGFHALPPLAPGTIVELTRGPSSSAAAIARGEAFFASLGLATAWVGDAPGLVLGRIVAQLVNECAFALGEGVASSAEDVDAGLRLGLNHPRGALEWADEIGLDHLLAILDGLRAELGEERYRAAPLLRRLVAEGRLGAHAGAGFHVGSHEDDA